eukprot:TRINITY_DN1749_c0_g2_i1.p1 TRINITY_DN1749_c0_g2~~TRINITY_DN1749_c0_g2_i1.p1  ORF type:complete len:141 (-),score=25.91 TRINITY_DN1749_c0_g2_i1:412-834(-)
MFAKRLFRGQPMKVQLPEKNTFIHFDAGSESDDSPVPLRPEATCPDIIQKNLFRTNSALERERSEKATRQAELHHKGECRPCAYYAFKKDGCRMGEDCEFCHLCDRSQVRRWQRLRAKALQADTLGVGEGNSRPARCCGA